MRIICSAMLFSFAALMASCNNEADDKLAADSLIVAPDSTIPSRPAPKDPNELAGCYTVIHNRDTSTLTIEVNGANVTGPLVYSLYEKDKNDGTLQGEVSNDILKGWYFFKSEGIMSVRQVIWKIRAGQLWPGMGEMKMSKDTLMFKDPAKLQYDSTHPFVKIPCVS